MSAILIVEDDARLHEPIRAILKERPFTLSIVSTYESACDAILASRFDAFIVDLGLPDGDGVRLIEAARHSQPHAPSLVLTSTVLRRTVLAALRAGACGYIAKIDLVSKLPAALDEVLNGGMPMSSSAARYLLEHLQAEPERGPYSESPAERAPLQSPLLSPRERELLVLIAKGLTYRECGALLGVSINTVRTHIRSIYEKLHASNKAEAVMLAMKEGWI